MNKISLACLGTLFLSALIVNPIPLQAEEEVSQLVNQAKELIKKEEKKKALELLEKAFDLASTPEEILVVGPLILEASGSNYPKRESYLKYMVRKIPEHAEKGNWLKELGDITYDKGNFDKAEDFYIRAETLYSDPILIRYKLAWTYWNQENRARAYNAFLNLHGEAEKKLKTQIRKDMAKLWWELAPIPFRSFEAFLELDTASQQLFLDEVFKVIPTDENSWEKVERAFLQLKDKEPTHKILKEFLAQGFIIAKNPCLLFQKVFDPGDRYPRENLLLCAANEKRPSAEHLVKFFERIPSSERTEKIDLAHAKQLIQDERRELALGLLLQSAPLDRRSKKYLDYTEEQILILDKKDFVLLEQNIPHDTMMALIQAKPQTKLLSRLQSVNPDFWIPYQEKAKLSKKAPKDFWVKKAVWVASQEPVDIVELNRILEQLFKTRLSPTEESIKYQIEAMNKRMAYKLPREYGKAFEMAYEQWLSDLDRSIKILKGAPRDWKAFITPVFKQKISANVNIIKEQLSDLKMPDEKKGSFSEDLDKKYKSYLADQNRAQFN